MNANVDPISMAALISSIVAIIGSAIFGLVFTSKKPPAKSKKLVERRIDELKAALDLLKRRSRAYFWLSSTTATIQVVVSLGLLLSFVKEGLNQWAFALLGAIALLATILQMCVRPDRRMSAIHTKFTALEALLHKAENSLELLRIKTDGLNDREAREAEVPLAEEISAGLEGQKVF